MIDLAPLDTAPRLLVEAQLRPLQTDRFQPTGFPDLGAAKYKSADGKKDMLLVESAQSMANRAEAACWDEGADAPVAVLAGLPYVHVTIVDNGVEVSTTSSVLEAHRINSPYVLRGTCTDKRPFEDWLKDATGHEPNRPVDRARFARALLRYDPASLVHGVFMSQVTGGRLRLQRALSAFIEACGVREAQSGGVKNDRVNSGAKVDAGGFGNVPFARTEYTAESITAFFNLDLTLLRSLGLPPEAVRLLQLLALFKIVKLTSEGMRLRTACDLSVESVGVTKPAEFALPGLAAVETDLRAAIEACKPHFADPPVTQVRHEATEASKKESKKASAKKAAAEAQTQDDDADDEDQE
jgi:CRISPR-associated protein Csb1